MKRVYYTLINTKYPLKFLEFSSRRNVDGVKIRNHGSKVRDCGTRVDRN